MFRKIHLVAVLVGFAATLSGCAAVPVIYAVGAADREEKSVVAEATLRPFVDFISTEIDKGVTASTLRDAKVFTAVLGNDMKTVKGTPSQREKELSNIAMEETLRSLSISGAGANTLALETLRIEVFYGEGRQIAADRYVSNCGGFWGCGWKKEELERLKERSPGIRKGIDIRLTLRRGDTVLMKASGFWGGNSKADEIAGARQLAREVASEVIKKLSASPASLPASVAEAETNKK